jgi:hypothetical protein
MLPAPAPLRFALDDAGGLRALRWLGRLVFVGSWWPIWYGLFERVGIDAEALAFGVPACVLGLIAWLGSGVRIRTPADRLEITAGEARLVRGDRVLASASLPALGSRQLREWRVGSTRQGSATTWFAVRFAGLGEHDLYLSSSRAACEAWAERIEAIARGESPPPQRHTLADLLALRFDALLARVPLELALVLGTLACAGASVPALRTIDDESTTLALMLAIGHALLALGFRMRGRALVGIALALLAGLAFAAKPWLLPVEVEFLGRRDTLSPTAETHFYYLIPGLLLIGEAVLMGLSIELQPPSPPAGPSKPAPVELPKPEPRFPAPPG